MLRTALKPVWLLCLVLALVVAALFGALSRWQFDSARGTAPAPREQTETAVPLTEHVRPYEPLLASQADQVVAAQGRFLPGTDVLVGPRLRDGVTGWWTVTAFAVDGAPGGETIPVVRGWSAAASAVEPAPEGPVQVTGRLLPPDGPQPPVHPDEDTAGRLAFASLAPGQLVNVWDVPGYAGYVAGSSVVDAAGEEVGVGAVPGGLEPVTVAPQPEQGQVVWLNVFYGIEWVLFAGFTLFLWWRFVRDDHERDLQEAALDEEWAARWRAEELARRREAARRAKEEAERAFAAHRAGRSGAQAAPEPDPDTPTDDDGGPRGPRKDGHA